MGARVARERRSEPKGLPTPFRIGVRPLGDAPWLCVDGALGERLDEKERLLAARPDIVHGALESGEAGSREALERIGAWLLANAADTHEADGSGGVRVRGRPSAGGGSRERLEPPESAPPLVRAARLVAEDLALLRRDRTGWRLVAGCIAFPSHWSLAEKLGRPLAEVHAPVPGYAAGSRNARTLDRMFDALRPDAPVLRGNWALHADPTLHRPAAAADAGADHPQDARPHVGRSLESLWLRHERQTLSKLPRSGDVLFTTHTTHERVAALDAARRARLHRQLAALDDAQRRYRTPR